MSNYLPLLLIFLLVSCSRPPKEAIANQELTYGFKSANTRPVVDAATLTVGASGILQIEVMLKDEVQLNWSASDWEIETSEGLRSTPIAPTDKLDSKGTTKHHSLKFKPINNLRMYQLAGLHGELSSTYLLKLKGTAVGTFKAENYEYYAKTYQQPVIYTISASAEFEQLQLRHLSRSIGDGNVQVTEKEILANGLNMVYAAYHDHDTLCVALKLINHSQHVISYSAHSLQIKTNDRVLAPVHAKPDTIHLPRSQRYMFEMKFFAPQPVEDFQLETGYLAFQTSPPVNVLYNNRISFHKLEMP